VLVPSVKTKFAVHCAPLVYVWSPGWIPLVAAVADVPTETSDRSTAVMAKTPNTSRFTTRQFDPIVEPSYRKFSAPRAFCAACWVCVTSTRGLAT